MVSYIIVNYETLSKEHKVKLFRVVLSTQHTDYVATNDMAQSDVQTVHEICGLRWKIEQFHRETKQVAGLEGCQNVAKLVLSGYAILVWVRLK